MATYRHSIVIILSRFLLFYYLVLLGHIKWCIGTMFNSVLGMQGTEVPRGTWGNYVVGYLPT